MSATVRCLERESGGLQCAFVGPAGQEHDHFVSPCDMGEPLPPACMNGTCDCPSAPDGADQHNAFDSNVKLTDVSRSEPAPPVNTDNAVGGAAGNVEAEHEPDVEYVPICAVCQRPVHHEDVLVDGQYRSGGWRHL